MAKGKLKLRLVKAVAPDQSGASTNKLTGLGPCEVGTSPKVPSGEVFQTLQEASRSVCAMPMSHDDIYRQWETVARFDYSLRPDEKL